jgi:hypothetical protein
MLRGAIMANAAASLNASRLWRAFRTLPEMA